MRKLLAALLMSASWASATDVTIKGGTYTLDAHPRVLLDGPSGTITTRVKDPDGAGPLVAPQATDANPTFVGLKALIDACAPTNCSSVSSGDRGNIALAGALRWYMDNSQADAKAMALYLLNNVELWVSAGYGFGCDVTDGFCGNSSWSDWPSETMGHLALAYTLMRSEMSAGERTTFAQKIFNDDVAGYEDGCTNQLQQEVGATATFVSGSTAVTGTNLSGLTAGRRVYFPNSGGSNPAWATIATVNSAVSVTLTGAPQGPLGGNAASQTSGGIYELKPWAATTCGLAWMLNHHSYAPRTAIMNLVVFNQTASYNAAAATITVSSVAGLPAPPFYINATAHTETMKVTAINGLVLSVDRGQLGTTAGSSAFPPKAMHYTKYIPRVGSGETGSNLVIQKIAGFFLMAIALADDSANAVAYVEAHANYWIDSVYVTNRQLFTGLTQGGSTSYGNGRQITMNHQVVVALKMIDAGLDKSPGNWLDYFADFYIMSSLPNSQHVNMTWGQPDLNQVASYGGHMWAPMQINLFGESSDQATHWNYFQRSVANFYTSGNLTSGDNEQMIPYLLLFQEEGFTATDYRATKSTQKAFNVADGDGTKTMNAWISRTGFSSTSDTLIFAQGYNFILTDHQGSGGPGGYRIYKLGFQMTEANPTDMGVGTSTNMLLFGGVANLKSAAQFQRTDIDRTDAGTGWAFARFNLVNAYTTAATATRALRHLVHIKPSGGQDYLVVFDSAATSVAKTISQNLQYDRTSSQPATMTDTTLPDLVWTGTNRRLSTRVVLPSGTGVASSTAIGPNHIRVTPCARTDGSTCANVSAVEFLIVHRPSTNTSDAMPTVAALGTIDADFSGVQIEDATNPAVVVFAEAGADQTSGSFTSTHAGTAVYVVTGLAPGAYDVVRDGVTTLLDDEVVGTDGTLSFPSVAGAFTLAEGTAPPEPCIITTTSLPSHVEDVAGYSQTLVCSGGVGPIAWTIQSGALCAGLTLTEATGVIAGTPTTQETCNFVVLATTAEAETDTQALSITITAAPPACTITTGSPLPNGTRNVAYSQVLASSGCTAPLSWTVTSGALCTGLTLTEATGALAGTPTVAETCSFTARLEDNDAEVDTQAYLLTIDPPAGSALTITTTSPLPVCVQHQTCTTQLLATGGAGGNEWTVTAGALCVGQSLSAGGVLSGVPTAVETCTFTVEVEDDDTNTDAQEFQRTIVNPSPTLAVQTIPGSSAVIAKFGVAGMDGSQQCDVIVSDSEIDPDTGLPIGPVASTTSTSGRATRVVVLGGLTPEHDHSLSVTCGAVASGSATFTTYAAVGGIVSWTYSIPPTPSLQARGAAKLTVEAVPADGAHPLDSGVAHHWTMNEESGARADARNPGATNSWTANGDGGGPGFGVGVYGNAAAITPSTYLSLPVSTVFPSTTFTLAFRVNVSSFTFFGPGAPIFVSDSDALLVGIDVFQVTSDSTRFIVYPSQTSATVGGTALSTGAWHLVMVWFNGATGAGGIQIDGGTPQTFTGGTFDRSGGTMLIAFDSPTANINALMDDVTLWNGRVLSADDRALLVAGDNYPFGTVSVTEACPVSCTVTLPLASGGAYNLRHVWKTAADVVLATSAYAPIVVP